MWTNVQIEDATLVVWPGCYFENDDIQPFYGFFQGQLNISSDSVTPVGCVETLPDRDVDGKDIPGTGGRIDFFFWLDNKHVYAFAVPKLLLHMRWWEDIYFNEQEHIYPPEFLEAYPNPYNVLQRAPASNSQPEPEYDEFGDPIEPPPPLRK